MLSPEGDAAVDDRMAFAKSECFGPLGTEDETMSLPPSSPLSFVLLEGLCCNNTVLAAVSLPDGDTAHKINKYGKLGQPAVL